MLPLTLKAGPGRAIQILCLGAHADDIEIGCGGTVLRLLEAHPGAAVHWVVLSGSGVRGTEARASARLFLRGTKRPHVAVKGFRDGFFPYVGGKIKTYFESLKRRVSPDLILTHYRDDRHQDHRVVSDLTWNTFRDHLILEYEIPKFDGDLGRPNLFVTVDETMRRRKLRHLWTAFRSQRRKAWFSEETFNGLMRVRGMESCAPGGYAEAFYARKVVLGDVA